MKSPGRTLKGVVAFSLVAVSLLTACGSDPTATVPATVAPAPPTNTAAPTADVAAMVNATLTAASGNATPADVAGAVQATLTASAPTPAPTSATAGFTLNPSVSGDVNLWMFWSSPVRHNAIVRVENQCMAQLPNIKVTDTFKSAGDGINKGVIAAVAAGSGIPDVVVSDRPNLANYAQNNVFMDLQSFADRDGVTGKEYYPFTWQQTLYNGHTYGLPYETDVVTLFYNKVAFKAAGLDPDNPPKTWTDVMMAASKLDKQDASGNYTQIGFWPFNRDLTYWGHTDSVHWSSDQNGKVVPNVNQPGAVETMKFLKSWYDHYGGYDNVAQIQSTFASPPKDAFMSGKVAMWIDVAGYNSQLNFYNPSIPDPVVTTATTKLLYGTANLPYNTQPGNLSGGFSLSIPKGAANPEASWEFIKCAAGPVGEASWSRDTYALAPYIAANSDPALLGDPNWKNYLDILKTSYQDPYVASDPNYFQRVSAEYEAVYKGTESPEDALKKAQDEINQDIATNGG